VSAAEFEVWKLAERTGLDVDQARALCRRLYWLPLDAAAGVVGHLVDVDQLGAGRLDDMLRAAIELHEQTTADRADVATTGPAAGPARWTDQHAAQLTQIAYQAGRWAAHCEVLTGQARVELTTADRPAWLAKVAAERAAQIEAEHVKADRARAIRNIEAGRHPLWRYLGGPVDWDTGLPAGSMCSVARLFQAIAEEELREAA
jgi:hypothetical protein